MRRLRIAYLTVNDPLDKRSWSGTTYYIAKTLQKNVGDVDFLGPVKLPKSIDKILRAIAKFTRVVFKKEYITKYSLLLSWYSSRILKKKMEGHKYDCICAPAASTELSYIKTDVPVIYISDTTFKLLSHYYIKDFSNIPFFSKWEGNILERKSLKKSSLVIYPSHWAAASAVNDYHIKKEKLFIMPFGANMDYTPEREMIYEKEENPTLTLLYMAVEWERKGGSIAFETLKHLHYVYGIKAKLIVCGCEPPEQFSHPYMEVIPFLNKNKPEDHERFVKLLSSVHFLIVPTRADCSLIVACEANAYGVPAITTDTGGVSEIVKDGINGYCMPYGADGWMYATLIAELFADKQKYHQLITTSRQRFEEELNWDKWADGFRELYETHINHQSTNGQAKTNSN
ncbi:MAG: glycosyltransferase family 4 protein [Chitinophagaceae bacterium]